MTPDATPTTTPSAGAVSAERATARLTLERLAEIEAMAEFVVTDAAGQDDFQHYVLMLVDEAPALLRAAHELRQLEAEGRRPGIANCLGILLTRMSGEAFITGEELRDTHGLLAIESFDGGVRVFVKTDTDAATPRPDSGESREQGR